MNTGGWAICESLRAHGVQRVFCVAGESYLPVLDALLDFPEIEVVTCRHESGATFMAEAYANLTGKPGIVFVTRGPGACNASIGIHTAGQSSAPVIMFVGLVARDDEDKEAFQEFDLEDMFRSIDKWNAVINRPERISEYVARAFHTAQSDRSGPVVLGLPEDILSAEIKKPASAAIPVTRSSAADSDLKTLWKHLKGAKQPLIIAGGFGWTDEDCENLASFTSAAHLPVTASFRRHDLINHKSANYIGELGTGPNPKLVERVRNADLVLVIGARLSEITTQGYTLFSEGQKIIHVHPESDVFGVSVTPVQAIQTDIGHFVATLAGKKPVDGRHWNGWCEEARQDYLDWTDIQAHTHGGWKGADMTAVFGYLRDLLPEDAVVTTDAGNFSGWCQRFLHYGRPGRLLAPISGAMGYAVPSVVSAAIECPDKVTVGICGDGGFLMTSQELATALYHKANPIIILCNNSMYGTIRMHQERTFPGRVSGTALSNPDFVKLAESYGVMAERVSAAKDFPAIFKKAMKAKTAALIEIQMDPRQISTTAKPK